MLGLPADGLSAQTRRSLAEHGEAAPAMAPVTPDQPAVLGAPVISDDLMARVRAEQERRAAESLARLRARRLGAVTPASTAPAPLPLGMTPTR